MTPVFAAKKNVFAKDGFQLVTFLALLMVMVASNASATCENDQLFGIANYANANWKDSRCELVTDLPTMFIENISFRGLANVEHFLVSFEVDNSDLYWMNPVTGQTKRWCQLGNGGPLSIGGFDGIPPNVTIEKDFSGNVTTFREKLVVNDGISKVM